MKERPILFSGEMIRALRSGEKTQTRRIVKPQPVPGFSEGEWQRWIKNKASTNIRRRDIVDSIGGVVSSETYTLGLEEWLLEKCPFEVGVRLWVREAWGLCDRGHVIYRADTEGIKRLANERGWVSWPKWRPSIHMARSASRITLEVTARRAQQIQSISEDDAAAEGVDVIPSAPAALTHRTSYARLWDKINGLGAWERNDWVFALSLRIIR